MVEVSLLWVLVVFLVGVVLVVFFGVCVVVKVGGEEGDGKVIVGVFYIVGNGVGYWVCVVGVDVVLGDVF